MSTITRELAKLFRKITNSEIDAEGNAHVVLSPADSLLINNARIALASLEAEPAIHRWRRVTSEPYGPYPWHYGDFIGFSKPVDGIEDEYFYTAPPAPVSVPDAMEMDDDFDSAFEHGKAVGWNAYRAAMLQAEPVSNSDELPLDYLQGHKDGLEWAAQLAEANHPQTGDWLYDDPIDLARAIRKGPDMPTVQGGNSPVIPDEVLSAIRKVARIRTDFDHFDGDRRGIGDCLDEAEQELIVTINKYASQLAAEPIATNDVREQQTAVPPIQADVAQAIENLKQKLVECNRYNYCADAVKNVEDACHAAMLQGSQPVSKREQVRREHAEWSDKTFGDVGPVGPLKHLSKEALEAAAEPDDLSEWADMQFLLWDAQRRAGISDGEITAAMEEKLKVNMARQWPEPKDGEPRQHLKPAPQTVPDSVISAAVNGIMATYADNAEDCREMVRTHVEQACRAAIQESGHG
ncbi:MULTISPECIES: DUF550 domain-containing protein [unclassified Enterobacter]|uniref:DUF550 domain-containing protein n=1 Tax=unclassified Enterobacter TaxID=2608935 RepID=UPI000AAA24A4|nr:MULTISPECIES: DUF550 domain-containing protein [unclassified Enterobacter]